MYIYVELLYCNRRRLLRVSAIYCGHNMWPKPVGGYADYNKSTHRFMHLFVISYR